MTPSPCINVCKMDVPSGLCTGCYRTIDEITLWTRFDERARRQVVDDLPRRRQTLASSPATSTRHER
ncbi:DUF1289 domain-containing protein [Dechloromonas sp.]|uniref:DUF1289 domain-containing protein n=1 Tax=Dechloromonas sp. TaxID=1917218 RepID=UPI00121051E4|nr:DUF1289 domain-containing protein [Dechloromonas sp.]MBU3697045.1 DUF1289 domain-containing protein [Dechloromonas sp.]TEX49455.1 MAG: hypothetical protein CFR70_03125 [Rhodocyclaceae bacterium]